MKDLAITAAEVEIAVTVAAIPMFERQLKLGNMKRFCDVYDPEIPDKYEIIQGGKYDRISMIIVKSHITAVMDETKAAWDSSQMESIEPGADIPIGNLSINGEYRSHIMKTKQIMKRKNNDIQNH